MGLHIRPSKTTVIMFKSVVAKIIAHNSTIPALAGNSDLRPLLEVIVTEKLVLQSYVSTPHQPHRFRSPASVYRDSARMLASLPTLCGHGRAVKAKTSKYVRLSSWPAGYVWPPTEPLRIRCPRARPY